MTATYSSYTVSSTSGIFMGTDFYDTGTVLYLTDASAKYLLLNGQIVRSPDYVPPTSNPTEPIPVTETNTTVDISVDGIEREVTLANLINLFPRLQPVPGPEGPPGPQGEQGEIGPQGPSISINGKNGAFITLTKSDIGLGSVANVAPADLPVSTATQAAIDYKLDKSKVGVPGGTASLDAVSGKIPINQIPGLDLPVSSAVSAAIAQAISNLIGGADAAYDTLLEIQNLLKGDDAAIASLLTAVNARLVAANNLSDLKDPTAARANLALGTLATQNMGSVQISGGLIDGVSIGASTAGTGRFTNLTATGTITGTLQGNAATATTAQTWATARTLSLAGFITGSISLNGSQDVSLTTTLNTVIPVASGGTGATTASAARANLSAAMSGANTDITSLNAPALGAATATTAAAGTSSTQVATTGFVAASFLTIATAAATYLAQADAAATYLTQANAASTYLTQSNATATYLSKTSATATYAPLSSPALTGSPTAPTATPNTNSTVIATTAYADASAAAAAVALAIALG